MRKRFLICGGGSVSFDLYGCNSLLTFLHSSEITSRTSTKSGNTNASMLVAAGCLPSSGNLKLTSSNIQKEKNSTANIPTAANLISKFSDFECM